MKYIINFKDKDVDDTTFTGVVRHTAGNELMYLWGPQINGRDVTPIATIPLESIQDFRVVPE